MAVYINLTGEDITVVDEDNADETVFPPSPDHDPVTIWFDTSSGHESANHIVVVDELVIDATLRANGLRFTPDPEVTYIISREAAIALHGHGKLSLDAVFPDGWDDEDGVPHYTKFVRLDCIN